MCWVLHIVITIDIDYIMFFIQYGTIVLSLDHVYESTSGIIIPYLMYWTYAQMDV